MPDATETPKTCWPPEAPAGTPAPGGEPYAVGEFVVTVWRSAADGPSGPSDRLAGPRLRVTHRAEPGRTLWASPDSGGFLGAAVGEMRVRENTAPASGFAIKDRVRLRCDRQTVDALEGHPLELEGPPAVPTPSRVARSAATRLVASTRAGPRGGRPARPAP